MTGYKVYFNCYSDYYGKKRLLHLHTYVKNKAILIKLMEHFNSFEFSEGVIYKYWIGSKNRLLNESAELEDVPLFETLWINEQNSEVNIGQYSRYLSLY